MMRKHVIKDAKTGEVTVRDYTREEEARADAEHAKFISPSNTRTSIEQRLAAIEARLGMRPSS